MSQSLEFSATAGMTLTATRCAVGAYAGTDADSVTQQAGTNRYLAVFTTEVSGAYRLDYKSGGTTIGTEVYDLSGAGTYQPRTEQPNTTTPPTAASVADAVWDEATSGHATAGTTGKALTTASSSTTITVVPVSASVDERVRGTNITVFTGELLDVSVAVTDAAGNVVDLDALTLEMVIESRTGTDVAVIADADITRTNGTFTVTMPSAVTTAERTWKWALRNTSDNSVLAHGTLNVVYAPSNDP